MSSVTMRGLRKTYDGKHDVVMGVDLQVNDGEFMVFVGPSGCGKTTLLRMIAGLEEISGGQLLIDDRIANDLPPMNRGIAMVFQSYALYPHMTVAENMGFSLKLSGASREVIRETVGRAAEILHISHLLDRKPKALSGGQRQRVAIGRAIVRKPGVFLFDEPLSNLDAGLRVQMRVELTKLHRELGSTMIYVTHDQTEAMTMGDRIAVFNRGILEQVGPPMELYREPLNTFVAGFLGSPRMNLLPATCPSRNGAISLQVGEHTIPWERLPLPGGGSLSGDLFLGVRPEHLELFPGGTRRDGIPAVIEAVEHLGDSVLIHATVAFSDSLVAVKLPEHGQTLAVGERIDLCPRPGTCHLFSGAGHRIA